MGSGKVYTGGQTDFYALDGSANNVNSYGTNGALASSTGYVNRKVNLNFPMNYTGEWSINFTGQTATLASGIPRYGFYRLQTSLDYRNCIAYGYDAWLNKPIRYDCVSKGTERTTQPYTYACNFNPALQKGILGGAKFDPSSCITNWQCVTTGNISVNDFTQPLTIMRNGENLAVKNPTVSVTGSNSVSNIRAWNMKNTVTPGSTPFLGTDPNATGQYFKSSWRWGSSVTYTPAGSIAFNWASDSKTAPFSWTQTYQFSGDFYVPTQATVGGNTVYEWLGDSADCGITKVSPVISVVRAINQ